MSRNADDIADRRAAVYIKIGAVRRHRADLVDRIRSADLDLEGIFLSADVDPVVAGTKLLGLIEALPDVGKVQTRRALAAAGIAESAQVAKTTPAQRDALASALDGAAA